MATTVKFRMPGKPPKNIKKRNTWFHGLTPAQQRVATAQDVILQLGIGKFEAVKGCYFALKLKGRQFDGLPMVGSPLIADHEDAQSLVDDEAFICRVCARGSIFASRCRLGNDAANPYAGHRDQYRIREAEVIAGLFPYYLTLEWFFELGRYGELPYTLGHEERGKMFGVIVNWDRKPEFWTARRRMTYLMKSIIENHGDLVIEGVKL